MKCNCEKEEIESDFNNELYKLIDEYNSKGVYVTKIMESLMSQIKIEASIKGCCYYSTLGVCIDMLTRDFEEMFNDINQDKEE